MADSRLSITVRDRDHPCAPYQTSRHPFVAQIYHCDGKPLHWKGVDGTKVPLEPVTEGGPRIHGQFPVPPGCYLVRALNPWSNVITDWAWVGVGCDATACVDLLIGPLGHCIHRMMTALRMGGTGDGDRPVAQMIPKEVQEALEALERIAERLPKERGLPDPPSADEVRWAFQELETEKK